MAAETLTPLPKWGEIIADVDFPSVPIEDLKPGLRVHPAQLLAPHPQEVYEVAKLGLTDKGIAGYFRIAGANEVRFHFSKTIAAARAEKARELMERVVQKAEDADIKGDMAAIKLLVNRLDPEPKEPTVVVAPVMQLPAKLLELSPDDINNLLLEDK